MTSWSLLPTDILDIIFEYVVLKDNNNDFRTNWHKIKEDIRSCQQTCKSWAVIAQMYLYKYVKLDTYGQAELFIRSLRDYNLGSLVKAISFYRITGRSSNRQKLSSLLQQIDYFCPDLKKFITSPDSSIAVWKFIRIERLKGAFSKLQVISPPYRKRHQMITQYYRVAYSLRETLRELTLYLGNSALSIENLDLESFKNINTLYFKLDNFDDVYTVDQQSKRCSSVEFIHIEAAIPLGSRMGEEYLRMRDARISPSVCICPQVKQLLVRSVPFDSNLCGYLMDVFPNLNKLEILQYSATMSQRLNRVPNNTAHRFLSYLMKMSSARVYCILVEDVEDLLMNFHDINGMNKHLSISYNRHPISYTRLKISANQKIDIKVVSDLVCKKLFYLPRLGIIEKSGEKFQSLKVNMNWISLKSGSDISYNGTDLYHILLNCPNMKDICIINASLPCFSTYDGHQRLRLSLHTFKMNNCSFGPEYLRDLSYHVNYIHELTIQEDAFFGSRVIDMPETEFYRIITFEEFTIPVSF